MSLRELLPRVSKGERLSAAQENILRDLATRQISGVGVGWDWQGTYLTPPRNSNSTTPTGIVRVCLNGDHPGAHIVFDAYLGRWNSGSNNWTFHEPIKVVDHFFGGDSYVYPGTGAKAWAVPRPSDAFGTVYELFDVDCGAEFLCEGDDYNEGVEY